MTSKPVSPVWTDGEEVWHIGTDRICTWRLSSCWYFICPT